MKHRFLTRSLPALLLGMSLFGCSTELDVTAPYKDITVVYCLLNKNDALHWVKINKAYLGEGDAYVYAQIPDSTEFSEAQLPSTTAARRMEKVAADGTVVAEYFLRDTMVDRVEGIFNGPLHKMYYFRGEGTNGTLDPEYSYRLRITPKGKEVSSSAAMVHDLIVPNPTGSLTAKMSFYFGNGYVPFDIKWQATENGRRYEAYYRFFYDEVVAGVTTSKWFDSYVGTVTSNSNPGTNLSTALNGELFYQAVANHVPIPNEAEVEKRIFQGIELFWWVAGSELDTYLLLANPISGIVEERPDYTNINGGYGLMSSRIYRQVGGDDFNGRKKLTDESITELKQGQYTGGLKFCGNAGSVDCN